MTQHVGKHRCIDASIKTPTLAGNELLTDPKRVTKTEIQTVFAAYLKQ